MTKTFVIAMDNEAKCVSDNMEGLSEERVFGRRVLCGRLGGADALVVVSGVGKSNAAAATQLALNLTGADEIVNFGVAGGLDPSMKVGDVYEVSDAVQYDFDLCQINGTEMGTLNERTTPFIPCAPTGAFPARRLGTGDRFNDSAADESLLLGMGVALRDMEGAAIAHVCETAGVRLRSVKCVSDVRGAGSMPGQYMENLRRCLAIMTAGAPKWF